LKVPVPWTLSSPSGFSPFGTPPCCSHVFLLSSFKCHVRRRPANSGPVTGAFAHLPSSLVFPFPLVSFGFWVLHFLFCDWPAAKRVRKPPPSRSCIFPLSCMEKTVFVSGMSDSTECSLLFFSHPCFGASPPLPIGRFHILFILIAFRWLLYCLLPRSLSLFFLFLAPRSRPDAICFLEVPFFFPLDADVICPFLTNPLYIFCTNFLPASGLSPLWTAPVLPFSAPSVSSTTAPRTFSFAQFVALPQSSPLIWCGRFFLNLSIVFLSVFFLYGDTLRLQTFQNISFQKFGGRFWSFTSLFLTPGTPIPANSFLAQLVKHMVQSPSSIFSFAGRFPVLLFFSFALNGQGKGKTRQTVASLPPFLLLPVL